MGDAPSGDDREGRHPLARAAKKKAGRAKYFWERLRSLFLEFVIPDWETLYRAIAFGRTKGVLQPLDSY